MAQRQGSGHVRNGWRGKVGDEPTALDQECEGDCSEESRKIVQMLKEK